MSTVEFNFLLFLVWSDTEDLGAWLLMGLLCQPRL